MTACCLMDWDFSVLGGNGKIRYVYQKLALIAKDEKCQCSE